MKPRVLTFLLAFLALYGCDQPHLNQTPVMSAPKEAPKQQASSQQNPTPKPDYERAEDFLHQLQKDKVDTIIFYKRTCINCCDFYNIFWTENGRHYLNKLNFDLEREKQSIPLHSTRIFTLLTKHYRALKRTPMKGNGHLLLDGMTVASEIDHYCYTQIRIYTPTDSIVTDQIKDHDFDRWTGYDEGRGETNDNYEENNKSNWNTLLLLIENELATMPETSEGEIERLRINQNAY